ncbi:hypothetical protein ANN_01853 [Periplaneta americana]|uniref:Uncharacterized protein n=1 Tax=Periplaneta americana TaxID=6978 RepID=A0ABQ8TUR0_PERAM|nr:hypothetical protein ANN_01853 [Periplaneta americana]
MASRSKASCLGLALRNARWFESSWGKKFSHEISSLMPAGNEFQSLGRAIVKEDEYEEVLWDVSIVSWRERVFRLWWEESFRPPPNLDPVDMWSLVANDSAMYVGLSPWDHDMIVREIEVEGPWCSGAHGYG